MQTSVSLEGKVLSRTAAISRRRWNFGAARRVTSINSACYLNACMPPCITQWKPPDIAAFRRRKTMLACVLRCRATDLSFGALVHAVKRVIKETGNESLRNICWRILSRTQNRGRPGRTKAAVICCVANQYKRRSTSSLATGLRYSARCNLSGSRRRRRQNVRFHGEPAAVCTRTPATAWASSASCAGLHLCQSRDSRTGTCPASRGGCLGELAAWYCARGGSMYGAVPAVIAAAAADNQAVLKEAGDRLVFILAPFNVVLAPPLRKFNQPASSRQFVRCADQRYAANRIATT